MPASKLVDVDLSLSYISLFLAHLAKGNMSFCHHLASVVCRPLTFHILIFSSETPLKLKTKTIRSCVLEKVTIYYQMLIKFRCLLRIFFLATLYHLTTAQGIPQQLGTGQIARPYFSCIIVHLSH
jgi:hypothetical protein